MLGEKRPRILIVDDEAPLMSALCNTLREQGYETTGFTVAKEALAHLASAGADLLLTDLSMPEMNGIDLLKAARQIDPELVGIMITGEGTIATAVEALKSGALDYILKPFKLGVILPVIARGLEVKELRSQVSSLQKDLLERNRALEMANKELEAFASSVAHDLHTPVRHIEAYAMLLKEWLGDLLKGEPELYLTKIVDSSQRLSNLIADLLRFSRLASAQLNLETVDLIRLIKQVRESLEPETANRVIEWKISELPPARGDDSLLQQVFYNLLSNAIKYTRHKSPAQIEVGIQQPAAGEPIFFVRDNGVGFDMNFAGKLFGVFQRLHSQEEFEGTGVGLANVRRIVERHGGRIWAEAKPNQGATFYFTLPVATAPVGKAA